MSITITSAPATTSPSAKDKKSQRKPDAAPGSVKRAAYSVNEFCILTDICRAKAYFFMRHGKLAYTVIGSDRRIPAAELERVIREGIHISPEEHRAFVEADRQEAAKRKALV